MSFEKHPLHIKNPELQSSEEVERAVERQEQRSSESIPNDPNPRIEAYMDRLENIFLNPDEEKRGRNLELFRDKIYDAFIIKPEVAADQILKDEAKTALDRGHGRIEITEEMKNRPETLEQAESVIKRQKASLDEWMDYLTGNDASSYDPWFKYYLWNSIIKLQTLAKIEKTDERTGEKITTAEYPKRAAGTLKPFPDIFRGKLAQIYDKYNKYITGEKTDATAKEYFQKNFAKLYAEESFDHIVNSSTESKEQTHGEWIKYEKGNMADAERMILSLQDKYTDWCIEGENFGKDKLNEGDIYIYYTFDKSGNPTDPRLCIRMSGERIAEVRGISGGKNQEVEQVFMDDTGEGGSVLGNKLKEFGSEADTYKKREADMKAVTRLMKKSKKEEPFTKAELTFLYELDSKIEGFGYQRDPRIDELRQGRNPEADMLTFFECTQEQIAHNINEINENTKAYLGKLEEPNIFQKFQQYNIEHIYTKKFPEGRIEIFKDIKFGGKTVEELERELIQSKINISNGGKFMLHSQEFIPTKTRETTDLVKLTVSDLGFESGATLDKIYQRAQELGLELCPADIGPELRIQYQNQPLGELFRIAMKPIAGADTSLNTEQGEVELKNFELKPFEGYIFQYGSPSIFGLDRIGGGLLWLDDICDDSDDHWDPSDHFVFRLAS